MSLKQLNKGNKCLKILINIYIIRMKKKVYPTLLCDYLYRAAIEAPLKMFVKEHDCVNFTTYISYMWSNPCFNSFWEEKLQDVMTPNLFVVTLYEMYSSTYSAQQRHTTQVKIFLMFDFYVLFICYRGTIYNVIALLVKNCCPLCKIHLYFPNSITLNETCRQKLWISARRDVLLQLPQ